MSSVIKAATAVLSSSAAAASATGNRAPPQGGVIEGMNPSAYDKSNPIILFIIQAGIIIIFCRILHWPLSLIRQPRVIAEVIGGIVLGPSVMFRIPGFQEHIFPKDSMPIISLVANLGLILFLFLIALEVDMQLFVRNWKVALSVGLAGMMLPFGLGFAIAWGLYHQFTPDVPISFGVYGLFIGTALSITAFPVLCRILTELNLLGTPVGVTVLAAGVGNDVVGWVLLALCVALVNNGSGITALYVVLATIGWILFLVFLVKPALLWILRRNRSLENGPSQGMVTLILLMALFSSWFTGIIGVHPIFGGFLVGLICPHDRGFTVKLTEKIEDLVTVLFLPLYFTLSGLNTNLGLLNDGMAWAYVVGVCAVAFAGKIIGGTLAARSCKLVWRESLTIGCLMSCKGLVELIVLNIGLQAKILSTKTFTIFVVMALVTTFATTPLVQGLYPPWYQKKLESWKRGEIDWDGQPLRHSSDTQSEATTSLEKLQSSSVSKLLVYLRLESLPSLFTFIALLGTETSSPITKVHPSKDVGAEKTASEPAPKKPLEVHGLRLLPLTERTSSVMRVSSTTSTTISDPVVNAFRTFASLNDLAASGGVSVIPESSFASEISGKAEDLNTDLVIIPWAENGSVSEGESSLGGNPNHDFTDSAQASFVREALDETRCNAVVLVNSGFGGPAALGGKTDETGGKLKKVTSHLSTISLRDRQLADLSRTVGERSHHIFFPFLGGADDKVALRLALLLCRNTNVTATILHVRRDSTAGPVQEVDEIATASSGKKPKATTTAEEQDQDTTFLHSLRDSLPKALADRVLFTELSAALSSSKAVTETVIEAAKAEVNQSPRNAGDLVVVGRHHESNSSSEVARALGGLAQEVLAGVRCSVLVVQAAGLRSGKEGGGDEIRFAR